MNTHMSQNINKCKNSYCTKYIETQKLCREYIVNLTNRTNAVDDLVGKIMER